MIIVAESNGTIRKTWPADDVHTEQEANKYARDLTANSPGVIFHVLKTKAVHGKPLPRADEGKPYGSIIFPDKKEDDTPPYYI